MVSAECNLKPLLTVENVLLICPDSKKDREKSSSNVSFRRHEVNLQGNGG